MPKNKMMLYQSGKAMRVVLGCIIKNPQLLADHKITQNDFVEAFHKLVFTAVNNLYAQGVTNLNGYIIDSYLKEHAKALHLIFTKRRGISWVDDVKKIANPDLFEMEYQDLKKFSLLRALYNQGFDVDSIYDPADVDLDEADEKREKFTKMTVDDIILHFRHKLLEVSQDYTQRNGRDSVKAGSQEAKIQKEKWKETPLIGLSYASNYLTTATDGMKVGRFSVSSAPTGTGK